MARSSVPKGKARYPVYRRRATDRTLFRRYKPPTVQTPLVTTSYTISTTPDPYSQSGPQGPFVDSSTGYLYTFLRDGAALEAWRSTDGGQNWTEQDAANHPDGPASGNMGGFSCFQVGSVIHIAVMHGGDNALYYNKFSTSTNTWDGTYKDFLVHDFTTTSSEWSCQMLVLANGDLFIASSSEDGFGGRTGRESVVYHYSQNGGSSWTKNNDWYGNSLGDCPGPQFVLGESEKIHGFVKDEWNTDGTNTIFHRSLVGVTGTPSAAEAFAVPSSGVAESNWFHPGRAFYIDDSGTERIVAVHNGEPGAMDNAAPFDLWAYEVVDDGTPSTPVQVTARGVKANEAAVNKGCVTGAVDPSTGTLYVLYVEEQSEDIYLSTRQNGGAWVKDRLFFSGDINILYANIYVRSGFYRLGVVYDDTYSGGYGTTKFLEYELGAAANVVTADPSTGRARGTATAAGSVIAVAQTAGRARGHATAAASVTATGAAHGRSVGRATATASVVTASSAVGQGSSRSATLGSVVVIGAAQGWSTGRGTAPEPTTIATVTGTAQGYSRATGTATGSTIVIGAAQGRSASRATSAAYAVATGTATGRGRGRGTGTGLCIVYGGKRTPSIAASSSPQVSTGTFAVGLPAGVKEGDLILLLIEMANQSTSDTTDPGVDGTYTKLFGQWNQTGSVAVSGAYLYAKVAGAAESDPTITETVTWNHLHVQSFIVRDHGLTSVAQVTVGAGNTGTGITATALGITVAIDDLVLIAAFTSEDLDSTTYWSGWTNANLSNITEWADAVTSSFAGGGFGLAVGRALTSSIGDSTVTKASAAWQAVQLGVRAGYGALGRASTRASTTGTTIRPASAVGWGQSRATADSTVIPAAQIVTADPVAGRSAGRGTASALVITSSTAQGNATGRGTATATATTTSSAVGRGVGRAVSVATVVTSSTAVGWAHARQMPMSLGIAISAAHGRAAGRATATGSVIVVSAAVGWSHARQMPMALGIPLASAHGRAHAHGTATASAITTTAAAQGWAHGYAPAMWLEVGVVTAQGLSRTRGRGSISASVTTAAAATARARGRATGVPLIIRSGAGRGWALARATAVATPLVLSASSLPGARGRAAAVAQRIAQGAAIGRGRAWGSANASVITTSTAIARTRGRATSSYAQVGLQTSAGAGWARARSAAVAQPITTSGVAAGQAHGTATAASVVTTTSASAGRARSHATGVGVRLLTSAGAGHGHGRSTAVPAVFATGAAVGHGRSRATAVCALQVLSASRASGRSATRVSSAATTTFGSAWARGRGRATASPLVRGLTEATLHLNAEAENFPLAFGGVADGGIHLNAQTELDALLASASSRSRGRQKATMQP